MGCFQWKMKTEIGLLYLVASEKGLESVSLSKQQVPIVKDLTSTDKEIKILAKASREIEEYFSGKLKKFNLPLHMRGSEFQKQVWRALQEIPYGETCSYKQIAQSIKNSLAVRAVGNANGKNPFCIVIPCHRVIASDGSLGGYSGGLEVKRKLLALEKRWR